MSRCRLALAACRLFFNTNETPLLPPLPPQPPPPLLPAYPPFAPPELARPLLVPSPGPSDLFFNRRTPEEAGVLVRVSLPSKQEEADPVYDTDRFLPAPRKLLTVAARRSGIGDFHWLGCRRWSMISASPHGILKPSGWMRV